MTEMETPAKLAPLAVSYGDIVRAAAAIRGSVIKTRFEPSRTLTELLGAEIWLKFENQQFTASYKERGALNKLLSLSDAEKANGVIAMSAGNHAQGVAYHAHRLSIPATIVMPASTPTIKVENTRSHGANVILEGQSLEDAFAFAVRHGAEHNMTFVHPYDDPQIIAGQGTVALEMLNDAPDLDVLIVPIGGGGLISGMAVAAKAINPKIKIIGVEAAALSVDAERGKTSIPPDWRRHTCRRYCGHVTGGSHPAYHRDDGRRNPACFRSEPRARRLSLDHDRKDGRRRRGCSRARSADREPPSL